MISGSQLYIFQDMPGIHSDFVVNKAHSHGNSEVMQSACICSLSVCTSRYTSGDCLVDTGSWL